MANSSVSQCSSCYSAIPCEANYCPQCGTRVSRHDVPNEEQKPLATPTTAERRLLTVLYCDIVSYSNLADSMDPEDLRTVINSFHFTVNRVVESYGSSVGGYRGDAVLIYFGYPVANENDTYRAVQAALELVRAVAAMPSLPGVRPEVRVGVATGLVVIGDVIESARAREVNVIGTVPNLAQRLQGIAHPQSVVVSEATYRLVGSRFVCEDLGPITLKGFNAPQLAWRALHEKEQTLDNLPAASVHDETTHLVGRETELSTLVAAWKNASGGNGSTIVISGEPGIGKSRLCRELRYAVAGRTSVLQCICSPRFTSTALFPVIETFRYHSGIRRLDDPQRKFAKLHALLRASLPPSTLESIVPYLASALSLDSNGLYPPVLDAPELLKTRTFDAILRFLEALAQRTPLLLILEDAHWADPTTLELLDMLSKRVAALPILVIVSTRPPLHDTPTELTERWRARVARWQATEIEVSRLGPADAAKIISEISQHKKLPPRVLGYLLGKGDGIPLFIEEMTKTTLESSVLREHGDYFELVSPLTTDAVPASLQESLTARLDRLGDAKEVARLAAVIGREFSHELLQAVALDPPQLDTHISQLSSADLLHPIPHAPQLTYRFKHALIRDAAYGALLKSERVALHAKVAAALEERLPQFTDQEPEFAAHHFTEAGIFHKAIPLWEGAAQRASARAAYEESVNNLYTAIGLLPHLTHSLARETELRLQVQLGQNLCTTMGYAAEPVEAAYRRARILADDDATAYEKQYDPIRGLCTFYIVRDELDHARVLADQCASIAESTGRIEDVIESGTALGYVQFYMGKLDQAHATLRELTTRYHAHQGPSRRYSSAQDPAIAAYSMLSHASWLLGNDAGADQHLSMAFALDHALSRPFNVAYVECYAAMLGNLRRSYEVAERHAQKTIAIATKHGIQIWLGAGRIHSCIARARLGQFNEAIPELRATLEFWDLIGARVLLPWFLGELAQCYRETGQADLAYETVEKAIQHATLHAETFALSELLRLRAELTSLNPESAIDACVAEFDAALALAQEQGAKVYALRALAGRTHFLEIRGRASKRDRALLEELISSLKSLQSFPEAELRNAARH